MLTKMTLSAQELEVIEAQCDLRIRNVERRQLLDVMHDHARLVDSTAKTVLTQMVFALSVFVPAILPCLRAIKAPCEFLCHVYHQRKRPSLCPVLCVLTLSYLLERK